MKAGKDILNQLGYLFPHYMTDIELWKPVGKYSVLIRKKRGVEFVFTYISRDNWWFETAKSFNERTT